MEKKEIYLLKNKDLPSGATKILDELYANGENVLFAIVGDLALSGKYAETAFFCTDTHVITYDPELSEPIRYAFADMTDVRSKRMYGNATISAVMPDGKRVVFFRYTYAVAALCDAAALFINHLNNLFLSVLNHSFTA